MMHRLSHIQVPSEVCEECLECKNLALIGYHLLIKFSSGNGKLDEVISIIEVFKL